MRDSLSYDDVLLVPQYSTIRSRADVNTAVDLGKGFKLTLPLLSSPMDTITEAPMAVAMANAGGGAVIHRYNSIDEQSQKIRTAVAIATRARIHENPSNEEAPPIGAAIGVYGDYIERAIAAKEAGATFLCIDVAHGHHILMKDALGMLKHTLGEGLHLMAGNVATLKGVNHLSDWGADSVRCNIGGGSICSTRVQTGHGVPGLQTIMDCAQTDRNVKIIADGGIKNSGDLVKALAAGADAVMCGSLLAGTDETPGKILEDSQGFRWKVYRGMASKEAQIEWRGRYASDEGVSSQVPYRGSVKKILEDLETGIRSGFSYSGAHTLRELHAHARFIRQTSSGIKESDTHITTRKW